VSLVSKLRNTAYLLRGHGIEISQQTWEDEYERGDCEYMHNLEQLARYHVLAGYVGWLRPNSVILEVGCGDGILHRLLAAVGYRRYVGLDLSARALAAAQAQAGAHATFVQADASIWEPTDTFDLVVFNETLYYFYDPLAVLRRYEAALVPDGLFLVSMYWRAGSMRRLWRKVARRYPCLHQTRLRSGASGHWVIRVLGRPGATPAQLAAPAGQSTSTPCPA
jgi:SAM-dependent methyltransferase